MVSTDSTLGSVSVMNTTTVLTSNSSRFSTSPEWSDSLPCHSVRRIRSSMCCCMRFCARMPRMLRTQTAEIFVAKSQRISTPITATAPMSEPGMLPAATSMARCTAHTWARLTATDTIPIHALMVA